ncbi:flagellar assembly protein FliW [Ammoniphilus resinae]|uniref:Flagellar assembly factor FliW n=1 Tax=Ammoniphilus resinae TaxID=861532 RepID=A0ABS4GMI6_9BACL|nr:flagellar assembly protein FliW [Ammoniphilus resinae]MBP1931456.1 flagellar assembly factor FliW [Ammoniphilus resinae]
MKISTLLFGEIEINKEQIIDFPSGIPGFPKENQFVFLPIPDTPFTSMQSVSSEVHFFVINPFEYFKDYEFDIPDPVIEMLGIDGPETVATWSILSLKENLADSTVNMQAPVIVNTGSRKGKQLVLNQYQIRQPIFMPTPVALQG